MADLVDIASKEVGYKEGSGNNTKYGKYTGANGMSWCHSFISWCGHEAGINTSIVPKTASTDAGMQFFKNKKRFKKKGTYVPKRNDIVYFKTGRSHAGIVEYVKGSTLHTIEGNSSDMVKRRTYSLEEATLTGYGVVSAYIENAASTAAGSSSGSQSASQELAFLKKVLKKNQTSIPKSTENYMIESVNPDKKVDILLFFTHNKKRYEIPAKEDLKVTWERKGSPGKLEFTTIVDTKHKMYLGDPVALKVNNNPFFFGFIFTLKPTQSGECTVTVYDQLRYFKNKDSYLYKKKTTTKLIRMIARDFGLKTGTLEKTKHPVSRSEQNKTLFDIVENSLTETMYATGKIYTMYDNYGKIMLRHPWRVNVLIDEETGQSYDYTTSIDDNVYNQIKLAYENKKTGTLDIYMVRHKKSQNKWGVLQYYDKVDSPKGAKLKAKTMLKIYNRQTRQLRISGAFGSTKVRAGCLVPVMLSLYDIKVSSYLLVDKVTHTFGNKSHTMDLELSGGDFDSSE